LSALSLFGYMARAASERIVEELMSQPHIEGRRISVLHIHEHVEERGLEPRTVADRFDLDVADIYHALAYYHDHPEEMDAVREARNAVMTEISEEAEKHRPEGVTPLTDE
jgi:uncharacterized protein (DUF433 family)